MKTRLLSGFLAACLLLTFTPIAKAEQQTGLAFSKRPGDVLVDEATFPDPRFRSWLSDKKNINGAGADGILTEEERMAITQMDVSRQDIQSLKGIEVFFALKELNCTSNRLDELDVSHNTALERLYCSYNNLVQLDLENNSNLISLSSSFNRISTLDISNKPHLKTLNSEMNYITQLTLDGSTALEWLNVANNQLAALDLSSNVNLLYVNVFDNQLTALDVSMLSKLDFLNASHNRLTTLDMSQNPNLSPHGGFFATNNELEELTLPNQENVTIAMDRYAEQMPITGYENVSWFLDEARMQPVSGDLPAEGQTLYAKRIANSYTIHFSNNSGNGAMPALSATYDQDVSLPEATFTRYGHTFHQWNTLPKGGGDVYADQATVRNLSGKWDGAKITLYAQWKPNQYQIVFDGNHPSVTGQMETVEATYGSSVKLPENGLQLSDQEFAGWAIEPDGPARYRDGATVQNLSADPGAIVTLYAVWKTPIADIQRPYLETLEQAFGTYSPEDYTAEDWTRLSEAYTAGEDFIRNADAAEEMEQYSNQAIEAMDMIQDKEARIQEILDGWKASHLGALDALQDGLVESNAAHQSELAMAAIAELGQLAQYTDLTADEDIEQIVGEAQNRLHTTAGQLRALVEAAQWVLDLDGLSTLPPAQVSSESAAQYRIKLAEYEALPSDQQAQIHPQVRMSLAERKELSDQKMGAISELQTYYRSVSSDNPTIQERLLRELERGVAEIEKADSAAAVQSALPLAQEALTQAATATPEPSPSPVPTPKPTSTPQPPSGGSGGGGSSSGGNSGGSSGGGISTYAIRINTSAHGSVTANLSVATQGTNVTIRVNPDAGYELASLIVTNAAGHEIPLQQDGETQYAFTMPASSVTIQAAFAWRNPFSDVASDAWYYDAVAHGVKSGLFVGADESQFLPENSMTRAMLTTVLYRAAGEPEQTADVVFVDVDPESWYGAAVHWAKQMGIVSGTGDGRFDPDAHITREQLATMLHRFADAPEATGSLEGFVDADQAGEFASHALNWAVGQGVINGMGDGTLAPKGMATRAQVSQMIMKFTQLAA